MELLKVWQKPRDDMQCDDLHVSSKMFLDCIFIVISSIIMDFPVSRKFRI